MGACVCAKLWHLLDLHPFRKTWLLTPKLLYLWWTGILFFFIFILFLKSWVFSFSMDFGEIIQSSWTCTLTYKNALSVFGLREMVLLWVSSSPSNNNNSEVLQAPAENQSALLGVKPKPVCPPVCVLALKSLEGQKSWRVRHCRVQKPTAASGSECVR